MYKILPKLHSNVPSLHLIRSHEHQNFDSQKHVPFAIFFSWTLWDPPLYGSETQGTVEGPGLYPPPPPTGGVRNPITEPIRDPKDPPLKKTSDPQMQNK